MVAARIAFETNIADTAVKGATFAEKHAEMVGQTSKRSARAATNILSLACGALLDGRERPRRNG